MDLEKDRRLMFTKQELQILLQLVAQANAETAEGKILLGNLQAKIEKELKSEASE